MTLFDADAALDTIASGTIDASFRALTAPDRIPAGLDSTRVLDEPVQLVTGPAHPFAVARALRLAGHLIWMPGIVPAPNGPPSTTTSPPPSASPSTPSAPTSALTRSSTPSPTPPR
ncbi:hypothetical protein [Actinomadura nitritigenes]|uniref:hypothetical protein n=1 Tax=Actinomadura nitritigenes TaxID=134602 RepID=UPI003D9166D7